MNYVIAAAMILLGASLGALVYRLGAPDWVGRGIAMGFALAASRVLSDD
jgi:hypothetical protein